MLSKRKYTELDIEKKVEIIALINKKVSQRTIARQFAISKTTVVNIGKNKDAILEMSYLNRRGKIKRKVRKTNNEPVNSAVLKFFEHCRFNDIPVTGVFLQKKAKEFAEGLMIENFQASNGWLVSFTRRNNISLKAHSGGGTAKVAAKADERKEFHLLKMTTADARIQCPKVCTKFRNYHLITLTFFFFFFNEIECKKGRTRVMQPL